MPIATTMPCHATRALLVVVCASVLLAPPAMAERRPRVTPRIDDPASDTTTTTEPPAPSSTTSTTSPSSTSSSTSTTSTTVSPTDPGADGDVSGGVVPDVDVSVPSPGDLDDGTHVPSVAIVGDLSSARALLDEATARADAARLRVDDLHRQLDGIDARILALTDEERQAVKRVEESRNVLAERAVDAYVRGNYGDLAATLTAEDPNEASRNEAMMESVLEADHDAVGDYRAARRAVSDELVALGDRRVEVFGDLVQAKDWDKAMRTEVRDARVQLLAFEAGSEIFVTGMHFPVDDPHDYIDSWLAPRSGGRQHQGIDIFAAAGTNLFAVERGVIANMGNNSLGGIKLWLHGESGTTYYYAHLLRFAPGISEGMVVEAGDVVGFVGNTGNAATTPSHLHFEIHPNNGPAVNPTPLLRVVDALDGGDTASAARR